MTNNSFAEIIYHCYVHIYIHLHLHCTSVLKRNILNVNNSSRVTICLLYCQRLFNMICTSFYFDDIHVDMCFYGVFAWACRCHGGIYQHVYCEKLCDKLTSPVNLNHLIIYVEKFRDWAFTHIIKTTLKYFVILNCCLLLAWTLC